MKTALVLMMMIGCTVLANIFLKLGASAPHRLIAGFIDWRVAAGIAFFGCAGILYAWLLQWVPLSVAQSFAAAQYIAVIVASAFLLSEEISPARWIGISLIAIGILVVGANLSLPASQPDKSESSAGPSP